MATRINDAMGSRIVGAHVPLNVLLAAIPSLPRPLLSRLTARMVERLDEIDGPEDLEDDDPREDCDPGEDEEPTEDDDPEEADDGP